MFKRRLPEYQPKNTTFKSFQRMRPSTSITHQALQLPLTERRQSNFSIVQCPKNQTRQRRFPEQTTQGLAAQSQSPQHTRNTGIEIDTSASFHRNNMTINISEFLQNKSEFSFHQSQSRISRSLSVVNQVFTPAQSTKKESRRGSQGSFSKALSKEYRATSTDKIQAFLNSENQTPSYGKKIQITFEESITKATPCAQNLLTAVDVKKFEEIETLETLHTQSETPKLSQVEQASPNCLEDSQKQQILSQKIKNFLLDEDSVQHFEFQIDDSKRVEFNGKPSNMQRQTLKASHSRTSTKLNLQQPQKQKSDLYLKSRRENSNRSFDMSTRRTNGATSK